MRKSMITEEINEQMQLRREKLDKLREALEPYGRKFERTHFIADMLADFKEGTQVQVAGRMMAFRSHGKTIFADLKDKTSRIQLYIGKAKVGDEAFDQFAHFDIGDILGIKGELFNTRTGEPTIKVLEITLLSKSLRPFPEKWHGLKDVEMRYRQRYLDLIVNDDVRQLFETRTKIISSMRTYLDQQGYLEVETPMMQSLAGGAVAKPFETFYEALNTNMYLRIAPELYLKRLLVGGMEKVYEINRSFRNEGISRKHNPEFTMVEIYAAYQDYQDMMNLTETLISNAAQQVLGTTVIEFSEEKKIDLTPPWKRMTIHEAIQSVTGVDVKSVPSVAQAAKELGVEFEEGETDDAIINEIFESKVEAQLIQPTFITDYPASLCPLAKTKKEDPSIAERFELFICGQELANAYSELNDPQIQLENFKKQVEGHENKEIDKDYIRALEYGMPPAGGLGIGIDRLIMLLTCSENIREVILFPQLKPEGN